MITGAENHPPVVDSTPKEPNQNQNLHQVLPPTKSAPVRNGSNSKLFKPQTKIPESLDAIDKEIEDQEKAKAENDALKNVQNFVAIDINSQEFDRAYKELFNLEAVTDQTYLLTSLKQSTYAVKGNKLILTVNNELAKKKIVQERDMIISFLRERTGNHTIIMEIHVEEGALNEEVRSLTLTNEDKRKMMEEKNPSLLILEQTFNTFLI